MAIKNNQLLMRFGVTQAFQCSYLTDQQEQLLVYVEESDNTAQQYDYLIRAGFRRSGEQIYRPYCENCDACQSIRILVDKFTPSRSQKRVMSKNQHLSVLSSHRVKDNYYPVYADYITQRHADGSMYPPQLDQFNNFIYCSWNRPLYLEAYDADQLVAVCIADELDEGLSALYTFFDPAYEKQSIGTYMILKLIEHARLNYQRYVYLGYQIDACRKMNYKQNFYPHERFYQKKWRLYTKKND